MIKVYRYRLGNKSCCAAGMDAVVIAFGDRAAFEAYFGGGMTFGLPSNPEYLGVWGARNASRFRRILREASLPIEVIDGPPPAPHTASTVNHRRLDHRERNARKGAMLATR